MIRLIDRVAVVTGGASGIGKAIAQRLLAEGATVVITDVQPDLGEATASELKCVFLEQDVRDEVRWSEILDEVEKRWRPLDILVNNAGIAGPMDATTPENTRLADWNDLFAVNVSGVFLGCRTAIRAMRPAGTGSIVNISSMSGLIATPSATAYGATKAAVRQLTKSVAQYCAQEKLDIRCNSVHPGVVRTPLLERVAADFSRAHGISVEEYMAKRTVGIPLGEMTRPDDVAAAVAFLASDDARHVTGTKLLVDGGIVECDTFSGDRWS